MAWVSATEAHKRLDALIEEVGQSHEPVLIIGKQGNAVLQGEDHWRESGRPCIWSRFLECASRSSMAWPPR